MTALAWEQATDGAEVHRIIQASDRRAAERSGTPAPARRLASTEGLVGRGFVRLGRLDGRAVVTVTVGDTPPYDLAGTGLPPAVAPRYMQRLAVDPAATVPLVGLRAVRHAVAVATAAGGDALRAEANPDLADVLRMLLAAGFTRYGTDVAGPAPRTYLQRDLSGG